MADDTKPWLDGALNKHQRLTTAVSSLLENILNQSSIEYLSVTGRTKTAGSVEEKIRRKKYTNPESQLTDLSGIRVITFLETQVKKISEMIRSTFDVDDKNSLDRASDLGDDKIGYRSTHFVCTLGQSRQGLIEYEALSNLKFEIQVRTVLQHAWAELAHDRSFKLGSGLPTKIQRKLNLYSGMLEIVDGAFDEIARDVEEYKSAIAHKTPTQLYDTELNSLSLQGYVQELRDNNDLTIELTEIPDDVIAELKAFGLNKIADLKAIAPEEVLELIKDSHNEGENIIGFLRTLMMYNNIERYFSIWKHWHGLDAPTAQLLEGKYGSHELDRILSKAGVNVLSSDEYT